MSDPTDAAHRLVRALFEGNLARVNRMTGQKKGEARAVLLSLAAHEMVDLTSARNEDGTPVALVAALDVLREKGLDFSRRDNGRTLLHSMMYNGWEAARVMPVARYLVDQGVPIDGRIEESEFDRFNRQAFQTPDEQASTGQTVLLMCAQFGRPALIEGFLALGADPDVRDEYGNTFLDVMRHWLNTMAQGNPAKQQTLFEAWTQTLAGHRQMVDQMNDPEKRLTWLEKAPAIAQSFFARMEQAHLDQALSGSARTQPDKGRRHL